MDNWKMFFISSATILLLSSAIYVVNNSNPKESFSGFQTEEFILPYNLALPDTTYLLPKELKEISGLTIKDSSRVYTINDEKAQIYIYDFAKGEITSKIDFGENGDFESVALKNNTIYAAKSDGTIEVVNLLDGKNTDTYKTPLSNKNDMEGLCYDASNNQLLIACKGSLEEKDKNRNIKGIYSFDLSTRTFNKTPFKLINLAKEHQRLVSLNLTNDFMTQTHVSSRIKSFGPSAIAINPIDSHIYVLSSRGKILTVMRPDKTVVGIYFLSKRLYGQPEGITFDKQGIMYISNEARSTKANILKFTRIIN